jgi:hypothetical protein
MRTVLLALFASIVSGCGGFVYNSPNHPNPIVLHSVERTLPVIGFMCDKKAANCKPAYTYPLGMRIGSVSVTPEQAEADVLGFWCNERAANCKPVYPLPAITQTTTMGIVIIQPEPVCARNGCLPYSSGWRYRY